MRGCRKQLPPALLCERPSPHAQVPRPPFCSLHTSSAMARGKSKSVPASPTAPKAAATNGASALKAEDPNVQKLRDEMASAGVDAYIIPSEDPHMVTRLAVQR